MCNGCGHCVDTCPKKALTLTASGVSWNSELCCMCDNCLKACEYLSSPRVRIMTKEQILEEIEPALPFIEGVTVSGGECTLQSSFVTELLREVHLLGKSAFVDTNGQRDFRSMPDLTSEMDQAMLDIKSSDPQEHKMLTGYSNEVVLKNAEYLMSVGKLYEIRTVVIPGILDNYRTVDFVSRLIAAHPEIRYKLIRFRNWGVRGSMKEIPTPDDSLMESLRILAYNNGVQKINVV